MTACNHAKDIVPWPAGSWVEERMGNRVRVVCGVCGRFYGYKRNEAGQKRLEVESGKGSK